MINIPLKYDIFVHIYHNNLFKTYVYKINYSAKHTIRRRIILSYSLMKFNITNLEKYLSKSEYSYTRFIKNE